MDEQGLTHEQLVFINSEFEVRLNATIKRLLQVNDVYGSPIMRTAILDELNGYMRHVKQCLLKPPGNGFVPDLRKSIAPMP